MTLAALQHLLRAASALAEEKQFIVLGSASLLASIAELGAPDAPLASTFDADLCPQPFDELTGEMLEQALGETQAYYRLHGYHIDILRDTVFNTLPNGWRDRLVPVPDIPNAQALDPHDLAAVKLLVGREKDLQLIKSLVTSRILSPPTIEQRIRMLPIPIEQLPRTLANFKSITPL